MNAFLIEQSSGGLADLVGSYGLEKAQELLIFVLIIGVANCFSIP